LAGSGAGKRYVTSEAMRVLERMNRELLARVKELELKQAGVTEQDEGKGGDSGGGGDFAAAVRDLHGEIDAAYVLKNALEDELAATRGKLSEAKTAGAQSEARASLLEEKAALADQLREDISFVEEEQSKTFRRLEEVTAELERVTGDRDKLAEQKAVRETRIKELQRRRFELEADVFELKQRLVEMVSFYSEKRKSSS
jgi:chromosome segregation ATPase